VDGEELGFVCEFFCGLEGGGILIFLFLVILVFWALGVLTGFLWPAGFFVF